MFKVSLFSSIIIFSSSERHLASKVRGREFRSHIYFCTSLIDLNLLFFSNYKRHWKKSTFTLAKIVFSKESFPTKVINLRVFTREYPTSLCVLLTHLFDFTIHWAFDRVNFSLAKATWKEGLFFAWMYYVVVGGIRVRLVWMNLDWMLRHHLSFLCRCVVNTEARK